MDGVGAVTGAPGSNPYRVYADRWASPLVAVLVVLNGMPCPSNVWLARALGLQAGQLDHALSRAIGQGRVAREVRRRSRRLSVIDAEGRTVAATAWSRSGGNRISDEICAAAEAAARAAWPREDAGVAEPKAALRAPVNLRCPLCNLPPDHAECAHGWNGQTTRRERRSILIESGVLSGRAAA